MTYDEDVTKTWVREVVLVGAYHDLVDAGRCYLRRLGSDQHALITPNEGLCTRRIIGLEASRISGTRGDPGGRCYGRWMRVRIPESRYVGCIMPAYSLDLVMTAI